MNIFYNGTLTQSMQQRVREQKIIDSTTEA